MICSSHATAEFRSLSSSASASPTTAASQPFQRNIDNSAFSLDISRRFSLLLLQHPVHLDLDLIPDWPEVPCLSICRHDLWRLSFLQWTVKMAFNFNWSPLSASTSSSDFYDHAKSLLTTALNKSAKPPIIVDDILVDDLNLGASAPDLEILEIGDIAEDRFRGIFRMSYGGDACLTLRTKVQVCATDGRDHCEFVTSWSNAGKSTKHLSFYNPVVYLSKPSGG